MHKLRLFFLASLLSAWATAVVAQTDDDDIWREVDLKSVEYKKVKSYCQRLYGYYRCIDDGTGLYTKDDETREFPYYAIREGICELDIRYKKDTDEGGTTLVGRNLVHPDKKSYLNMLFYELAPYTFLEKARRDPKHFRLEPQGDTTHIYGKHGLAGTAVRDKAGRELRIDYNAYAPDTAHTLNLILLKLHASRIQTKAVYSMEDDEVQYVPQGALKHIEFDGNMKMQLLGEKASVDCHANTVFYIDSVVYMTQQEYRADMKLEFKERLAQSGYTVADIDRLKQKFGVPPLTAEQLQRIEDQRDWDDAYELWKATDKEQKAREKKNRQLEKTLNKFTEEK